MCWCCSCWVDVLGPGEGCWEDRSAGEVWVVEASFKHCSSSGAVRHWPKSSAGCLLCTQGNTVCCQSQQLSGLVWLLCVTVV